VKLPRLLAAVFIAISANLFLLSFARAEDVVPPEVTTIVTQGGDDVAYHIPLTVAVVYDGVTYQNVYATTNSVITFGRPDGTYWDYPITPSISIESKDWWVLPQQMPDTHFIINVSDGGFQVDGSYRPYGTFTGDTTSIIITGQVQTDGTVAYTYAVNGPLTGTERTGARLTDGTVVPLEEANIIQVEEAPVLEPEPVAPEPVVEPEPVVPQPPTPEVIPEPVAPRPPFVEPVPIEPEPTPEPEPIEELPEEELPPVEPEPTPEPPVVEPEPETIPEPEVPEEVIEEPTVEEEQTVTMANRVVVTLEVAQALELLSNPTELLATLFTDPAAAFAALGNVGADLPPEVREKAESVVLSAIIAGNIATSAAASAAGAAAYRRKP
jgi:hypothetical protein